MPISDLREQRSPQRNQAISLSFPQHVDKELSPQELSLLQRELENWVIDSVDWSKLEFYEEALCFGRACLWYTANGTFLGRVFYERIPVSYLLYISQYSLLTLIDKQDLEHRKTVVCCQCFLLSVVKGRYNSLNVEIHYSSLLSFWEWWWKGVVIVLSLKN